MQQLVLNLYPPYKVEIPYLKLSNLRFIRLKTTSFLKNLYFRVSKEGSVVVALFVIVAAGLLFIPEITRLTSSKPPSNQAVTTDEEDDQDKNSEVVDSAELEQDKIQADKIKEIAKNYRTSNKQVRELSNSNSLESEPFEKILHQLEEKEYEIDNIVDQRLKGNITGAKVSSSVGFDPPVSEERALQRKKMAEALSVSNLTIATLNDPLIVEPVRKAVEETKTLLKVFDKGYSRSRFALVDYLNGLQMLLKPQESALDPKDLIQYVGLLDIKVTQQFIEEKVGRTEYMIWRAISLSPLVYTAGQNNVFSYQPPFRANITVTSLDLRENIKPAQGSGNSYIPSKRYWNINVIGVVQGKEIGRVLVYHGKTLIKIIELSNIPPNQPSEVYRRFDINFEDDFGNRPYTLRAVAEDGKFVQKSYSFVAMPIRRFTRSVDGRFVIPGIGSPDLSRAPSKQLDEILAISGSQSDLQQPQNFASNDPLVEYSTFDRKIDQLKPF
jgi:hypothetical protein